MSDSLGLYLRLGRFESNCTAVVRAPKQSQSALALPGRSEAMGNVPSS